MPSRAVPVIAVSAAGVAWLLHVQGTIDTEATGNRTAAAGPTTPTAPTTTRPPASTSPSTFPTRRPFPGDDDEEGPFLPGGPTRSSTTTAPPTTSRSSGPTADGTVTGPVVDTRWGPVQVQVTLQGGRITDVRAVEYPGERRRSAEINDEALPILHDEVIAAQSADIDVVSGATYTTEGYTQSLQAALDSAKGSR